MESIVWQQLQQHAQVTRSGVVWSPPGDRRCQDSPNIPKSQTPCLRLHSYQAWNQGIPLILLLRKILPATQKFNSPLVSIVAAMGVYKGCHRFRGFSLQAWLYYPTLPLVWVCLWVKGLSRALQDVKLSPDFFTLSATLNSPSSVLMPRNISEHYALWVLRPQRKQDFDQLSVPCKHESLLHLI